MAIYRWCRHHHQRPSALIAVGDLLIVDLDNEIDDEITENHSQTDLETTTKDFADQRTADSKLLREK